MKYIAFSTLLLIPFAMSAQTSKDLPFRTIPDYPEEYTASTVVVRLVDGLGFRYFWATEGLRDGDLSFRSSDGARSSYETLQHIYQMSEGIKRATMGMQMGPIELDLPFDKLRRKTLENYVATRESLLNTSDLDELKVVFGNGATFPFWNLINGQISDSIWHVGQIVSFRRSSGNPFNGKASVFLGKLRD